MKKEKSKHFDKKKTILLHIFFILFRHSKLLLLRYCKQKFGFSKKKSRKIFNLFAV